MRSIILDCDGRLYSNIYYWNIFIIMLCTPEEAHDCSSNNWLIYVCSCLRNYTQT